MSGFAGKQITRNGVTLNVLDQGAGPAVMLLHGVPDSNHLWRHQIPALVEEGYRVIAPDHRGFGLSDKPEGADHYTKEEVLADWINILDVLGIEQTAVVCHDWGAIMGWPLIDAYPERFTCFMPMSVGPAQTYAGCGDIRQKEMGWYALLFMAEGAAEQMMMADDWYFVKALVRHHPELEYWLPALKKTGPTNFMNWYRANMQWLLGGSKFISRVPTKGLWSDGDVFVVEEQMVAAGRYVDADWHYEKVTKATHWMMLDRPDHINRLIVNFLKRYHPAQ